MSPKRIIIPEYPAEGDPLIRGDQVDIPVTFDATLDVSTYTWLAQIRATPDGDVVTTFDVVPDGTDPAHKLTLHLDTTRGALLANGQGFDLQSVTPVAQTFFSVRFLRVEKDFSHA